MATINLPVLYDTYVYAGESVNQINTITIRGGWSSGVNYETISYFQPDLSTLPAGATISSVILRVYRSSSLSYESHIRPGLTSVAFNTAGFVYSARPSLDSRWPYNAAAYTSATPSLGEKLLNVTDQFKAMINEGHSTYAIVLQHTHTADSSDSSIDIFASQNNSTTANRPYFIVTYTDSTSGSDERLTYSERIVDAGYYELDSTESIKIEDSDERLTTTESIKQSDSSYTTTTETIKNSGSVEIDSTETISNELGSSSVIDSTERIVSVGYNVLNISESIQGNTSADINTTESIKLDGLNQLLEVTESIKASGYKTLNLTETVDTVNHNDSSDRSTFENVNVISFKNFDYTLLTGNQVSEVKLYGFDYTRVSAYKWLGDVFYDNADLKVKLTDNATADVCYASLQVTQSGVMPAHKPTSVTNAVLRIFYSSTSYTVADLYSNIDFDIYVNGVERESRTGISAIGTAGGYAYIELPITINTVKNINAGSVILIKEGGTGSQADPYHNGKGLQVSSYGVQVIYTDNVTYYPGLKYRDTKETVKDPTPVEGGNTGAKTINATEAVITPDNVHTNNYLVNFNNLRQQIQANSGEVMFPELGITTNTFSEYHLGDFLIKDYLNPWDPLVFPYEFSTWVARPSFVSGSGTGFFVADPQCKAYIFADATSVPVISAGTISNVVLTVFLTNVSYFLPSETFNTSDTYNPKRRFTVVLKTVETIPGVGVITSVQNATAIYIDQVTTKYSKPCIQFKLPDTFPKILVQGSTLEIVNFDEDFEGKDAFLSTTQPFELSYMVTTIDNPGSKTLNCTETIKPKSEINTFETITGLTKSIDVTEKIRLSGNASKLMFESIMAPTSSLLTVSEYIHSGSYDTMTVKIPVTFDTYVVENSNNDYSTTSEVMFGMANGLQHWAYFKADFTKIPTGCVISKATLYTAKAPDSSFSGAIPVLAGPTEIPLYISAQKWESRTKIDQASPLDRTSTYTEIGTSKLVPIDCTKSLQYMCNNKKQDRGIVVTNGIYDDAISRGYSVEGGHIDYYDKPYFEVTYRIPKVIYISGDSSISVSETIRSSRNINTNEVITADGYELSWWNIGTYERVIYKPPVGISGTAIIGTYEQVMTGSIHGVSEKSVKETITYNASDYEVKYKVVDVVFDSNIFDPSYNPDAQYNNLDEVIYAGADSFMYLVPEHFTLPDDTILVDANLHILKNAFNPDSIRVAMHMTNKAPASLGQSMTWDNKPVADHIIGGWLWTLSPSSGKDNSTPIPLLEGAPQWYSIPCKDIMVYMLDNDLLDRGLVFWPPDAYVEGIDNNYNFASINTTMPILDPFHVNEDPYRPSTDPNKIILPATPYYLITYLTPKVNVAIAGREIGCTERIMSKVSKDLNAYERLRTPGYGFKNTEESVAGYSNFSDKDSIEYIIDPYRVDLNTYETIITKTPSNLDTTEHVDFGPSVSKQIITTEAVLIFLPNQSKQINTTESIKLVNVGAAQINNRETVNPYVPATPITFTDKVDKMALKVKLAIEKYGMDVDFVYTEPNLDGSISRPAAVDYYQGIKVLVAEAGVDQSDQNIITAAKTYYEQYEVYIRTEDIETLSMYNWKTSNASLYAAYAGRWLKVKDMSVQTLGSQILYARLTFWADELTRNPTFMDLDLPFPIPYN